MITDPTRPTQPPLYRGEASPKVLIVIQCTNLGGMEQCTRLLVREFNAMGVRSEVLSLNPVGALGPLLSELGVRVSGLRYKGKWGWRSLPETRSAIQSSQADALLMVGHNAMASLAIGDKCKGHRLLSLHYHHTGVMPSVLWRVVYRLAVHRFTHLGFVSRYIMREAVEIAPFIGSRSLMISTPVPARPMKTKEATLAARASLGLPSDSQVVGNAGWLIPRKRWDVFLQVCAAARQSLPRAVFLIAGDGPEREALRARANALGLQKQISWLGWQKNLEPFYQALDVLLFNSDWDAQPRTPLEAMSYGVPIVASVVNGGTEELVDSPDLGIVLPTHHVKTLAESLVSVLADPARAELMGRKARQRMVERCHPTTHALKVLGGLDLIPENA